MSDWDRSVAIDPSAFEDDDLKWKNIADGVAEMGRQNRLYTRWQARKAGMAMLPGYTIYMGSRGGPMTPYTRPDEDLSIWGPGEREYVAERDKGEP